MKNCVVVQCFAVLVLISAALEAQQYTVCTTVKNLDACEQLNRSQDIKCIYKKNAMNCIQMVESGNSTIVAVSAEEAILVSSSTSNLVVLAEFMDPNANGRADFEIAILVNKHISGGFGSLKQAIYCHPGVDNMQVSPFMLNEFEKEALAQNNVDICNGTEETVEKKSLNEYYIKALNNFFGPSCRPGIWSIVNNTLDTELKKKYTKLTQICELNAYKDNVNEPFLQSLNCVLSGGEVAITTISTIEKYLASNPNGLADYTLLCRDGSNVNVIEKCSWSKQPWPLLLGHKDQISNLPQELTTWFNQYLYNKTIAPSNDQLLQLADKYVQNLKEILFPSSSALINITTSVPNLATYIKDFREVPTKENARLCKSSVSFCTISTEEEQQCKLVQQAALNYNIQPILDCVLVADKDECLKGLQNEMIDIVILDINSVYTVNRKNLTIVAFGEDRDSLRKTVMVVNGTIIKTLADLENRNGCFSEYGDMAWLAFVDMLKQNIWNSVDYYGEALNNYLNDSCMPGVEDKEHEPYPVGIDFIKVCEICETSFNSPIAFSCKPDYTNEYYGNEGALKCLEFPGDFAVLTYSDNLQLPNGTSIMCKNGTLVSTKVDLDDNCFLSVSLNEQIVVRKSDSKTIDIIQLLLELDERFAAQTHTPLRIFDSANLMFKETTVGIDAVATSNNKYVTAVMDMFQNIPELKTHADGKDSAFTLIGSPLICFILLFVIFL